jgi:hypothetical protein
MIVDGMTALRNLDLAVLNAKIKKNDFRERTIPELATTMAIKLSRVFSPLFSDIPPRFIESNWDGFATWQDKTEDWKERQICVTEMFKAALMTKADACLNLECYEMVVYAPGTNFDPEVMIAETMEGMRIPDMVDVDGERKVLLCIEAAIFTYPRESISISTKVSECLMLTNKFVRKQAEERRGFRPLVKAVVILG